VGKGENNVGKKIACLKIHNVVMQVLSNSLQNTLLTIKIYFQNHSTLKMNKNVD
jgi:hypothetical protein